MRGIPVKTAAAAERLFNTPDGKSVLSFLSDVVGLTERTFIPDSSGRVDPYRAAIKDGERAVVSMILKLQKGQTHERDEDKTS